MKKLFTFFTAILFAVILFAQAPQIMSYQAVVRDASNKLVVNHQVGMQIRIVQSSEDGKVVYTETQTPTTNANGLVSIKIGGGAGFTSIDWAKGPYFIKTETDPSGGTSYTITGVSQLLSVPYALYAEKSGSPGPQGDKGDKGDKGDPGQMGIQGVTGATGLTTSVNGVTQIGGAITLTKSNIGLGNVDNTSDDDKPVSSDTQDVLDLKVDKVSGKGLSSEDYTSTEKTKLAGIATGAQVNVKPDWSAASGNVAEILNKPTLFTTSNETDPVYAASPAASITNAGSGVVISSVERSKLSGIAAGANVGVVPNLDITGATKTKIKYDKKGLVIEGTDATTADIAASFDKNYVTDAQKTVIGNTSGTNTGDNAVNSNYSGLVSNVNHSGDAEGATALTVTGINGVALKDLTTGILKNTTGNGKPSIAVAGDFPTLNQNTTGTAVNVTGTVAIANGGTGATTATNAINALLPTQTGNSGKYLTTNGSATSWAAAADGSETKVTAGTNVTVTGAGTTASPYVVNATGATNGTAPGQMQYWNGTIWTTVTPGSNGAVLTLTGGVPTWKVQLAAGEVQNSTTGKIWMDRNLGASQVATSSADATSYGDLYQWGRLTDGHEKRTSATTATRSASDIPGHGNFITRTMSQWPFDWLTTPNDNLWQGVSGTNNPCPSGYRLPTKAEWDAERLSWSSNNSAGAFASPLKLPLAGYRECTNSFTYTSSYYWSSTIDGVFSFTLRFHDTNAFISNCNRADGCSVRCIKD